MKDCLSDFSGTDSDQYRKKTIVMHLCSHEDLAWPGLDLEIIVGGLSKNTFYKIGSKIKNGDTFSTDISQTVNMNDAIF